MKTRNRMNLDLLPSLLPAAMASCSKPESKHATLEGRWSGFESGSAENITVEFTGNRYARSSHDSGWRPGRARIGFPT